MTTTTLTTETTMPTAASLIRDSIQGNRIARAEHNPTLAADLLALSTGHVDDTDRGVIECWGVDEDSGDEWRVHLITE